MSRSALLALAIALATPAVHAAPRAASLAITYHGGATFPMVAQKRPSTYRSQPQAERAR